MGTTDSGKGEKSGYCYGNVEWTKLRRKC